MDATSASLAVDARSLDALRSSARNSPDKALLAASRQFEAVFMQMVLKSMRSTIPDGGLLGGNESKMYSDMFDTQLTQSLARRGVGVGDMLARQLARAQGRSATGQGTAEGASVSPAGDASNAPAAPAVSAAATPATAPVVAPTVATAAAATALPDADSAAGDAGGSALQGTGRGVVASARAFVEAMLPHAEAAARKSGVPAQYILGQAALESGWGRRQIVAADGSPSNNLFGIKAGAGWMGRSVDVTTTEYVNGVPRKMVQRFRAYASLADGFADYASLIAGNSRYAAATRAGGSAAQFAQGLQRGGYATDPAYADKLTRVINQTLRLARDASPGRSDRA